MEPIEKVKIYLGISPYDGTTNICRGDPYYYQSLCSLFGSEENLQKEIENLLTKVK